MVIADVKCVPDGCLGIDDGHDASDSVINMAKAAGLGAASVDGQGLVLEGGGDEAWDDHAVVADLAGTHSVEEADDANP